MGKTVGAIISVGLAVAVNVIPGVGQAISGAIFGGLSAVTGTVGLAASAALTFSQVAAFALTTGLTINGLQTVGGILGLGPSAPKPDQAETAIKNSRPPRVSAYGTSRLYGAYILYETAPDGAAVDVYAVHDGELTQILQYYLADDAVTLTGSVVNEGDDGRYADSTVKIYSTTGASPGASISAVTTKLGSSIWGTAHRGDGVVQLAVICEAVKSKHFLDIYPNGVPVASMAAKWQKCPDPYATDPTDESAWTWTENAIRHLMHYMLVHEQIDYATKIAPALDYWKAAADVCDEDIALKAGGTEKRWRSCVAHKHTDTHASVKSAIMQCCDGWIATRSDGAYVVYAGKYYTPTISIGADEIIAFEWNGVGVDDDEAINEIICSYVSADHDYNTVETNAWRDEDDIAERGQILTDSLEPQVPSWGQVRRLAKRQMARKNALYRGTVTTNASGRVVRGERFINLTLTEAGTTFYDGPVEITAVTRNLSTGGVTFSWVAVDPNIDAWNPATEEGDPAPVGNRVALEPLTTPTIDTASAVLSSDGSFAQISVTVDAEDRSDLTWFLRWKLSANTVWNEAEYTDIDAGTSVQLLSDSVPSNASVDVSVAYQVGDGRTSDWASTETVDTTTENLAPSPNTAFTANGGTGEVSGSWSNSTSSNFGHSELWYGTTSVFGSATQLGGDYTGGAGEGEVFTESLSADDYYLWTVSYNSAGTAYSTTGPIPVTVT
ncbi:hypothetical protein [Novosphingobium pentaromativorans]|uniref:Tip attachment protein J domain-containing protein n=1 Tax=Novosphingobium pentaromativorans US6-1 TaxID=1088721 RepID=G6E7L0_9SPHN|nr:hypothetical protein [Novosphingobium pentaromativorans]AIT81592.1 hypothetical protein JI59_18360 [Novosphingobium pentaromativorans US6-1]EHJ62833.1 hypothetical protein NSU_0345 [Novosphingobium pentaromativorans US6-1]